MAYTTCSVVFRALLYTPQSYWPSSGYNLLHSRWYIYIYIYIAYTPPNHGLYIPHTVGIL